MIFFSNFELFHKTNSGPRFWKHFIVASEFFIPCLALFFIQSNLECISWFHIRPILLRFNMIFKQNYRIWVRQNFISLLENCSAYNLYLDKVILSIFPFWNLSMVAKNSFYIESIWYRGQKFFAKGPRIIYPTTVGRCRIDYNPYFIGLTTISWLWELKPIIMSMVNSSFGYHWANFISLPIRSCNFSENGEAFSQLRSIV